MRRLVGLILLSPACALLVPLDDLGSRGDSGEDGFNGDGPGSNDGGVSDADAMTSSDASDASDASSPCAVSHTFCEDFNTGAVPFHFDSAFVKMGKVLIEGTTFVSPSQSMRGSTVAIPQPSAVAGANLQKTLDGGASQYDVSLWYRVESSCFIGDTDHIRFAQLMFAGGYQITFDQETTGSAFNENVGDASLVLLAPTALDAWHHIVVSISLASKGGTFVVDNGSPHITALSTPSSVNTMTFWVGPLIFNENGKSGGCVVDIDDVTVDVK